MELTEYVERRNKALITLDKEQLTSLFKIAGVPIPEDEETFWAGIHKARIQVESMPSLLKTESKKWLEERGFSSSI